MSSSSQKRTILVTGVALVALAVSGYYLWKKKKALQKRASDSFNEIVMSGSVTPKSTTTELQEFDEQRVITGKDFKSIGNTQFAKRNYEEAIEAYTNALEAYPDGYPERALAFANLAACHLNLKHYDQVVECCESALKLQPLYQKAIDRRGRALEGKGMLKEALSDYTLSAMLGGFKDENLMLRTESILKTISEKIAFEVFEKKEKKMASPRACREFFDAFSPFVQADTLKDVNDQFRQGVKSMAIGDYGAAMNHFKACLETGANAPKFLLANYYGSLLFLSGKHEEAVEQFEIALKHSAEAVKEEHTEVLIKKAFLLFDKGDMEEAIRCLAQASEQGSHNPYTAFHSAEIYLLLGESNAALEKYDQCIKLRGDFLQAYIHKSKALIGLERFDESQQFMKRVATKLFSEDADALNAYGETFIFQQNYEAAKSWILKALGHDPKHLTSLLNMAVIEMTLQTNHGKEYLDKALSVEPHSEVVHLQLANYYLMSKDDTSKKGHYLTLAHQHFESALENAKSLQDCLNIVATRESSLIQAELFQKYPELEAQFAAELTLHK